MFSDQKTPYFGLMLEEGQDPRNTDTALTYIQNRVEATFEIDLTHDKDFCGYVFYLRKTMTRKELADRVMKALFIRDPERRLGELRKAVEALSRNVRA